MMLGVLQTNRDQVLASLKEFQKTLGQMEMALQQDDLPALQGLLDNRQDRYQKLL
jgi:prephenate dehydrogenase